MPESTRLRPSSPRKSSGDAPTGPLSAGRTKPRQTRRGARADRPAEARRAATRRRRRRSRHRPGRSVGWLPRPGAYPQPPTVSAVGADPGAPIVPTLPPAAGPSLPAGATTSVPRASAPATARPPGCPGTMRTARRRPRAPAPHRPRRRRRRRGRRRAPARLAPCLPTRCSGSRPGPRASRARGSEAPRPRARRR